MKRTKMMMHIHASPQKTASRDGPFPPLLAVGLGARLQAQPSDLLLLILKVLEAKYPL